MKKKILIVALLIFLINIFYSCSKYDENPMLTIGTKKQHLVGYWVLTELQSTYTTSNSSNSTSFIGGTIITTSGAFTTSEKYNCILSFEKEGIYKMNESRGVNKIEVADYWTWVDGVSGKEMITLGEITYQIKKLTGHEMILENNYSIINKIDTNSYLEKYESLVKYSKFK